MSEESDIIKKIRETKRETAELQHQLQNLIDEGKNLSCFSKPKLNYKDEEKPVEKPIQSTNKQQIIPSYDKRNLIRPESFPVGKEEVKTVSPKKTRTYDVKQTREYMKKQKERLIVKQKQTQDERKIKADIQKKKLDELHRKSRELLAKNVQANRERSKSRDKNIYVRPDDAVTFPSNLGKAKSLDRVDIRTPQKQKNLSSLYPPDLNLKGSSSLNQKGDPDKILILARNYTRPGQGVISKGTNLDQNFNLAATNTQLNGDSPGTIPKEQVDVKNTLPLKQQTTSRKLGSINKEVRYKPKVLFKSSEGEEIVSPSEALNNESKHSNKSISSANLPSLNIVPLEKVEEKIKPFEIKHDSARIDPLIAENKAVSVDRKKNSKYTKSVTEIQKENSKKYPSWLQEQPPQADPFNFINTIKRKLQAASMPKPTTDVGIQSSCFETASIEETFPTEQESRGPELLKKSDLKSFNSHNRLNLDSRTIDHLELVPRKSYDQGSTRQTTYNTSENESESDTSKNIPEISSESGTSLKKNAESVRNALKIVPPEIATKTLSLTTDSNVPSLSTGLLGLPSSKSSKSTNTRYVEDFDSDSNFEASSESLERSRRSVITFNKPEYNEVTISPSKSLSTINTETAPSRNLDTSKFVGNLQENSVSRSKTSASSSSKPPADLEKNNEKITSSKKSSVHRDPQPSNSSTTTASKSNLSVRNINTKRGSGSFNSEDKSEILLLVEPTASLVRNSKDVDDSERSKKKLKNISVKSSRILANGTRNDTNQIHLKFEAEIHLLNDFNESLKRFSALEQAVETLKINNSISSPNILENNAAQPSLTSRSKTFSKISEHVLQTKNNHNQSSHINYSRGSFINSSLEDLNELTNSALDFENSVFSTGLDISNINESLSLETDDQPTNFENLHPANFVGVSINMFDQLIKDEDTRLENLKAILKIREQALLDRTKGELAWLEIQRKHFKETGKLHEASVVKKKQRGILVNHQKEKHEMQRLKQMQKVASIERKIVLKEQRNLIRQQLFTNNNILTKVKVNTNREKRLSGPLKVLQSHTESIRSETSISRKSSVDKDFTSVTSHQSIISRHSMVSDISGKTFSAKDNVTSLDHQKFIKKTLLMREAALKRRRKAAEELLQWHKKLLDEEKRIAILESTASAIISQKPNKSTSGDFNFKGKQLNQLWFNLTGSEAKKFADDKIYLMSQRALESFCKNAREFNTKKRTLVAKTEVQTDCSVSERIATPKTLSEKDYMSDFENESIKSAQNDIVDQSIDLLINNFNQIQDDISSLSVIQTKRSDESIAGAESETEASVINITSAYFKDGETASSEILSSADIEKTKTSDSDVGDTASEEISELKISTGNRHPDQTVSHKSMPLSEELGFAEDEILTKSAATSENKSDSSSKSSGLDENDSQKIVTDKTSLEALPQISDPELSIKSNLPVETKELVDGQNSDREPLQDAGKEEDSIASEESSASHAASALDREGEELPRSALNESQEILLILGEDEVKTRSDEEQTRSDEDLLKLKDSLDASKEILSKLSEQAQEEDQTTDDPMSQSLLKLYQISEADNRELDTFSMLEVPNSTDKNQENIEESFQDGEKNPELTDELEETDTKSSLPFKIDESNENQTFLNNLVASSTEMNIQQYIHEESDESKLTLSDKSNESFVINEINDNSDEKVEENSPKKTTDECRSITEDVNEESEAPKTTSHFEYGVLPKSEETETFNSSASGFPQSKEEIDASEDKEHDSLSNCESSSEAPSLEEQSLPPSEGSSSIKEDVSTKSKNKSSDDVSTFKEVAVDVKKRVSEILAETNISRGDKSPRLQDLYVTTYDLISPANSPEKGTSSPREEHKLVSSIFDSEAEEILRKQLAVEEEIKAITEQQQKQQVPQIYIREIPNKPPPPYTPPSATASPPVPTIIPSAEEIEEITMYSAKILHKAYLSNNLTNVNISNNTLSLISKDISNDCYKFVFNLCKDIAREHYKQFEEDDSPPWLRMSHHQDVSFVKPLDPEGLKTHMIKVLKELFGYQKPTRRENTIIKWSRKKRDHVDEILVMECQQEESQWTDYRKDELLVKDEITNDIFDSLLKDTARVLRNIYSKRKS